MADENNPEIPEISFGSLKSLSSDENLPPPNATMEELYLNPVSPVQAPSDSAASDSSVASAASAAASAASATASAPASAPVTSLPPPMSPSAVQSAGNRTVIIHFGPETPLYTLINHVNGVGVGGAARVEYIFEGLGIAENSGFCRVICETIETKAVIVESVAELVGVVIHTAGEECSLSVPCGL